MKKIFLSIFFLIFLFSCQKSEISQNFSQNSQSENFKNETYIRKNFHGFQIFFENKESKTFYTFDEMEKLFETNDEKIARFGDVTMVHNDDIASMPDFLVIQILEKILEKPDKVAKDFTIYGLTESQLQSHKMLEKIQQLPIKKLIFSTFYANMNDYPDILAKKFLDSDMEIVEFFSLEGCNFVSEK